jgi:hypothetical protein
LLDVRAKASGAEVLVSLGAGRPLPVYIDDGTLNGTLTFTYERPEKTPQCFDKVVCAPGTD